MKKFWKRSALLLCLLAGFGFVFTACGGDDDDTVYIPGYETPGITDTPDPTDTPSTPTEIPSGEATAGGITAPTFEGSYFPASGANNVQEDVVLAIKFDDVPTIDKSVTNAVQIYNGETLVDTINPADEKLWSIVSNTPMEISVKDQLITVVGKTVLIHLHADKTGTTKNTDKTKTALAANTEYTVKIANGLLAGKVDGVDFTGIADWKFTTRAAPSISGKTINVGSAGDFYTIQGALDYLMANVTSAEDWTISLAEGSYHERLGYYGSANVTLVGPSDSGATAYGDKAVIYWKNFEGWNTGSRNRTNFLWEGGNLTLKNVTLKSTYSRTGDGTAGDSRNEVLYFDSTSYLAAHDCSFLGTQDTLILGNKGGRCWFYKDYIVGDVDFIWGYADVALFEECVIRVTHEDNASAGYIFASRTVYNNAVNKGFVLMNSVINVDDTIRAYYGRNSGDDSQATVLNCVVKNNPVQSILWYEGGNTAYYAEDAAGEPAVAYKDYNNTYDGSVITAETRGTTAKPAYAMSKRIANREYNGRHVILNRGFDVTNKVYTNAATVWDLTSLENDFGATEDKSKKNVFVDSVCTKNVTIGSQVTLTPSSVADGATYTWKSSDDGIATVANGVVTAVSAGTATITVTSSTGATDTATVVVIDKVYDISVTPTSTSITLDLNGTKTAGNLVTVGGADSADAQISYTIDNMTIASISDGTVTAHSLGDATLTVKEAIKDITVTIPIHVKDTTSRSSFAVYLGQVLSTKGGDFGLFSTTGSAKSNAATGDKHGWAFDQNATLAIPVTGACEVRFGGNVFNTANDTVGVVAANSGTLSASSITVSKSDASNGGGNYNGGNYYSVTYSGSGATTLTFTFKGTKTYVPWFAVINTADKSTARNAIWDWTATGDWAVVKGVYEVNGNKEWLHDPDTGIALEVDAKTSGGKVTNRAPANPDAQVNKDTVIYVPVSNGSVVTIVQRTGKAAYSTMNTGAADYTAATALATTVTASANGYVAIKATAQFYLSSISVTNVKTADCGNSKIWTNQ